jgi:YfiH family protein
MEDARISSWSAMPGLVHGFGRGTGERGECRERTRDRVREVLEPQARLMLMRQVHGTELALAPWAEPPAADAAGAEARGVALGIETADCLPVLFVDARTRRLAAAHAGWRGTAAGIVTRVVSWLVERGSSAADLRVALGPCIGACCYEVGDELRPQFEPEDRVLFRAGARGRPHLDLRAINERQLVAAGIRPEHIEHVAECTRCRPDLYFSFRRDGAGAGRMISYIGWERD